tara:strand:+ start:299 stop:652 length:354 start_codon:yes stop_codon:yes gene_type:complete
VVATIFSSGNVLGFMDTAAKGLWAENIAMKWLLEQGWFPFRGFNVGPVDIVAIKFKPFNIRLIDVKYLPLRKSKVITKKKEYTYVYPRVRQLSRKQKKMGMYILGVSEKGKCKLVKN